MIRSFTLIMGKKGIFKGLPIFGRMRWYTFWIIWVSSTL